MAKFKVGYRVRVIKVDGRCGSWCNDRVGKIGIVDDDDEIPSVSFEDGIIDWGGEDYLELVEESKKDEIAPKTEMQPMTVNITVTTELTHITIGGKRFRLVPED